MSTSKSKGPILRELGGGQVRVVATRQDWETRMIKDPGNPQVVVPVVGTSLVAFEAESYREFGRESDLWEFRVDEGGQRFHVYLAGDDIFMLYVPSALA